MRTFDDAHREAIAAGCPLALISRRIDKRYNGVPVTRDTVIVAPEGVAASSLVQASAFVTVPAGPWRPKLLVAGWYAAGDGCEVEVSRSPAYDPRLLEAVP